MPSIADGLRSGLSMPLTSQDADGTEGPVGETAGPGGRAACPVNRSRVVKIESKPIDLKTRVIWQSIDFATIEFSKIEFAKMDSGVIKH